MAPGSSQASSLTDEQRHALETSTIVPRLARKWYARCRLLPLEDLEGIGWVEATACAAKFDPKLAVPFDGFARDFVHFAMQRAVSRERRALDEKRGRIVEGGIDSLQVSGSDLAGPTDPWNDTDADLARNVAETADALAVTLVLGAATVVRAQAGEDGLADRQEWSRAMSQLDACIASLPDELRRVLELHHLGERPLGAVAEALGMSEPTARRRNREALVLLAKRLRAAGVSSAPVPGAELGR